MNGMENVKKKNPVCSVSAELTCPTGLSTAALM
jgi:hypothetical protein